MNLLSLTKVVFYKRFDFRAGLKNDRKMGQSFFFIHDQERFQVHVDQLVCGNDFFFLAVDQVIPFFSVGEV